MSEPADQKVIACNYAEATKVARKGALAYVVPQLGGNLPEAVPLLVRSRGGRWVEKWERVRYLGNFRLKTLPPEHPRYRDARLWPDARVSQEDVDFLNWLRPGRAYAVWVRATGERRGD